MGSFEDAVQRMLGAPPETTVTVEIEGGREVQIGDMTWDTEPTRIVVEASTCLGGKYQVWSHTFDTIPELWAALMLGPATPTPRRIE